MDDSERIARSKHSRINALMSSWRCETCRDLHRFRADKIPGQRRDVKHKIPPITPELFAIGTYKEKES